MPVFADASENGFAGVVYLRFINGEQTHVSFLHGKYRVCPKKKVYIPRMELMAIEMSVLVVASIKSELDISVDSIMY